MKVKSRDKLSPEDYAIMVGLPTFKPMTKVEIFCIAIISIVLLVSPFIVAHIACNMIK